MCRLLEFSYGGDELGTSLAVLPPFMEKLDEPGTNDCAIGDFADRFDMVGGADAKPDAHRGVRSGPNPGHQARHLRRDVLALAGHPGSSECVHKTLSSLADEVKTLVC